METHYESTRRHLVDVRLCVPDAGADASAVLVPGPEGQRLPVISADGVQCSGQCVARGRVGADADDFGQLSTIENDRSSMGC